MVNIIGLWSGRLVRDALQVTTSFGIIIPLVGDLLMIAKGNVKIGIEWRFGADWPSQRCGIKHLNPRKIKVQVTAVTRPCITSNPLFNGRVFSKSCPRYHTVVNLVSSPFKPQ